MTARIREFLKQRTDNGPCLVVDLDVVRENYFGFAKALPDSKVFYAVKANPAPEILRLLAELGACFDVASVSETEAVLEYFDACRAFWKMGAAKLDAWSAAVRAGRTPDFGANLVY